MGKRKHGDKDDNNDNKKPSGIKIKTGKYSDADYKKLTKLERHHIWQMWKEEAEKQKQCTANSATITIRTAAAMTRAAAPPHLAAQI